MESTHETKVYWSEAKRSFIGKYWHDNGWRNKSIPVDITNKHKARSWFDSWHLEFKRGNPDAKPRIPQSLRSLLPLWLEWKRSLPKANERDIKSVESVITRYTLDHLFGDLDLERELKIGACVDWIEQVQSLGRAPFTVRNIIQTVRSFISDCRGKGWIDLRENPFNDGFVKGKTRGAERVAGNETIIHLTAAQASTLLSCTSKGIPSIRRAMNCLAMTTGLRAAEMQALRWSDLHLDERVPYVDVQRQLVKGSTIDKPGFKPPKRKSYRQVPLHPLTVRMMKDWQGQPWTEWAGRPAIPEDPVFPTQDGQHALHLVGAHLFRQDLVEAGIPAKFEGHNQTFHALRRTFLTLLSDAQVPEAIVARLAGHGAKTVTQRHYVAKNIDVFYAAVLKLFPTAT